MRTENNCGDTNTSFGKLISYFASKSCASGDNKPPQTFSPFFFEPSIKITLYFSVSTNLARLLPAGPAPIIAIVFISKHLFSRSLYLIIYRNTINIVCFKIILTFVAIKRRLFIQSPCKILL